MGVVLTTTLRDIQPDRAPEAPRSHRFRARTRISRPPAVTIPVVAILDGGRRSTLACRPAPWTYVDRPDDFCVDPTGGRISSFSSYGLSPDLSLKPDIGAPGGFIFSDVSARTRRLRHPQRHVDGVAARGGRGGAVAAGASPHAGAGRAGDPAEQRRCQGVVG